MNDVFNAVKITEKVYWVGAVDWKIRDFHGYATDRGTTYNAYLILDDVVTLIDTVKLPFENEMLDRIRSLIDPKDISVIVSNHSEMDHSGCLPEVIEYIQPDHVYASKMGVKALNRHFQLGDKITPVENGQTISLGQNDITFLETRMLHWPDSMISYLSEEKLLFSQDAFGMHLASNERFSDEVDDFILEHESEKYFANILLPYTNIIPKALEKIIKTGFELQVVAPDHGPILRTKTHIQKAIDRYIAWSAQSTAKKAVIVFDSMWESTALMARAIGEGLQDNGISIKILPLSASQRSDVATEVLDAGALIVGSPTLNNGMFPTVADVLCYLKGLKPKNLVGAAFGSYGWSGEGAREVEKILTDMKVEIAGETINVQYVPSKDDLQNCYDLGKTIADKLKEKL